MKRKPNKERQAKITDMKNDKTKGNGLYVVEKGKQKGADASVMAMRDANGKGKGERPKKNEDVNGGKGTVGPDDKGSKGNKGKGGGNKHLAAGVKYLMEKYKDKKRGGITRAQAVTRAKRNITADRANRSYGGGFDWAKDGVGAGDRDMGSAKNNAARKRMGANKKITVKANVRGASSMGTGKVLIKKPKGYKR